MTKYKLKHKEEAMKVYLEGNSFQDVATILQERYKFVPPLNKSTVRKWSDSMGWQELMQDVKHEVREVVREQAVKRLRRFVVLFWRGCERRVVRTYGVMSLQS